MTGFYMMGTLVVKMLRFVTSIISTVTVLNDHLITSQVLSSIH